jgi:carbamoyltransferase
MTAAEQMLFGIEKLSVPRSTIPAVTHVDLFGPDSDRARGDEFSLLCADQSLQITYWLSFAGQHELQSTRRAHREHAGRRVRCFMGSELDELFVEHCRLDKSHQNVALKLDYKNAFVPD